MVKAGCFVTPLKISPPVHAPLIITRHEPYYIVFEYEKLSYLYIANKNGNSEFVMFVKRLVDSLNPHRQHCVSRALHIIHRVLNPDGIDRRIAARNKTHDCSDERIVMFDRLDRPRAALADHIRQP